MLQFFPAMHQAVHDMVRSLSKGDVLSVPDTTEVEPEIDGSLTESVLSVRYTQKCGRCERRIGVLVPLYMSPERIGLECNERQHRVVIVAGI